MQTLEHLSASAAGILKLRKKNRRRLGLLLGVLSVVYFEAVKARFDSLSKLLAILIKIFTHMIQVHKPKSKRAQYVVLLGAALIAKYLTRFDVFPDDLDQLMNLPNRS